jgi:hypothetical protein
VSRTGIREALQRNPSARGEMGKRKTSRDIQREKKSLHKSRDDDGGY